MKGIVIVDYIIKKNKILVGCLSLLLVLSVGYALFSETITINGTATAEINYNLSGNGTNTTPIFALKPPIFSLNRLTKPPLIDSELKGLVFNKFTGARGKSGSNDANAEYIAQIRKVMEEGNISFQTAELGKVDVGGGGTIAYILSLYGMEVIDCGVAVLNMHAPWEITSKADVYEAYKSYKAFLKDA